MKNKKIYFIDIIYYNAYKFYRRYEKDLNEFSAQLITSLSLCLNIEILILMLEYFNLIKLFKNKWETLYLLVPLSIIIFYRYNKMIEIDEIEDILFLKEKAKLKKINFLAILYLILSLFGSIIFAVVLGELNNPPPLWENWFK